MAERQPGDTLLTGFVALARRYGVDTTVDTLRRRYVFSDGSAADPPLLAMAVDVGLEARWVRMRATQLTRLSAVLPAMLRLRDGGALILDAVANDDRSGLVAHVSDPVTDGKAVLDESQLATIWDGQVLLLKQSGQQNEIDQPFGLQWLIRQILREKRMMRDIGIASIISTVFVLSPPFITLVVLDRVLVNKASSTLLAVAFIMLTMVAFEMLLTYFRRLFTQVAATRIDGRLSLFVMERLMRLPMDYFETTPVGHTTSKVYKIINIRNFLTGELFDTCLDMITLLFIVPILFILNWILAFWVMALGIIIFFVVLGFLKPLTALYHKVIEAERMKQTYLIETLQGIKTVKSLALEGRRRRGWDERVAGAVSSRYAFGIFANYPQTIIIPFERLIYSGSVLLGAALVLYTKGTIQPGQLVAFVLLAARGAQPLVRTARLLENLGEVRSAIGEVASVVNAPPETGRGENGLRLPIRGDISFERVKFRYSPESPLALDEATFEIGAGTIFGVMGRSGSGKTTITRLLQGLNRNYEGAIKVDGMDLKEIDLHHLRTSIGVVPQENFLFTGSVRDNIGMARPDATFAQIVRAAQLAGAEEFIEKLPRGYNTWLEEGATNLSGGQRQRLALARTLLTDPPVLVLDEATSSLDAESEAIINANLVRIAEGRTIICVSHRLSMLVGSDAILVMDAGRAYDLGTHEELLHRCDVYKHLWHQQNRHLEPKTNVRPLLAHS
jgi:subfamily B ATP-binding cassette protein HlyB/CyaB